MPSRYPGEWTLRLLQDKLGFLADMARHGDITRLRLGLESMILVNDPAAISELLDPKSQRFEPGGVLCSAALLLDAGPFQRDREDGHREPVSHFVAGSPSPDLAACGAVVVARAQHVASTWHDGAALDLREAMQRLTIAIAGELLVGSDGARTAPRLAAAVQGTRRMLDRAIVPIGTLLGMHSPLVAWRVRKLRRQLDGELARFLMPRDETPVGRFGLDGGLNGAEHTSSAPSAAAMNRALAVFMAWQGPIAAALCGLWYLLARHPLVYGRLQAELHRVLAGATPTLATLPHLPYTRQVVQEALRLYPPHWVVERRTLVSCRLGGCPVPAGSLVLASPYLVHRDPRWYDTPLQFRPERWTDMAPITRAPGTYFPTAAAPWVSELEEQFAWQALMLIAATIARDWIFWHDPSDRVVPDARSLLLPKGRLQLRLSRRMNHFRIPT